MLCVLAITLLLTVHHEASAVENCAVHPQNQLFTEIPESIKLNVGESVRFNCSANVNFSNFVEWKYQFTGDKTANTLFANKLPSGFSLVDNGIIITNLNATQDGVYTCFFFSGLCMGQNTAVATLTIRAAPRVIMETDSYTLNTQDDLVVTSTIAGFPVPMVTLHYVQADGSSFQLSAERNPRLEISFESSVFRFSIQKVLKAENGTYRIRATNEEGDVVKEFTVNTNGPDPPVLKLKDAVVSTFYNAIQLCCQIQPDAYDMDTSIVWTDGTNVVVPSKALSTVVYAKDYENGTVQLTIASLDSSLVGNYKCNATNSRGSSVKATAVSGPPPPPSFSDISVNVEGSSVTVGWMRPVTVVAVNITKYQLNVYRANENLAQLNETTLLSPDQSSETFTFLNLEPGNYEVTVTSVASSISGNESKRHLFEIAAFPVVLAAAVVGSVAGLLLIIGVTIGIFFCCSWYARKKVIGSQQQRWGSDEENVAGQNSTIVQTYTALALNETPELNPSPMNSMMAHAVGVDPKWEFPRENIHIYEELAGGQFTVLHKGLAIGFKDNKTCEVAVKSLRDGATEDDLKALLYEMDMLASIEDHPDIVSLVRVCSVGKPILMVMEYMCHGDLLGFLRSCRGHPGMYTVSPGLQYQTPALQLCSRDLLNMATKIASGMRYLADRKIVHRALCAKNILVGNGMDVKIYNVGSFDVALDSNDGVKLMAPESLFDGTNTIYSDVWSFGVTLWELVTVGGIPYVDILPEELYSQLQSGMRMSCPPHCAQEVYEIMCACWEKNPTDRPHFAIIHENLDELVMSKLSYIDLRNYDSRTYSQFGSENTLSTAL